MLLRLFKERLPSSQGMLRGKDWMVARHFSFAVGAGANIGTKKRAATRRE
jgi:hypothetical protein